MTAWYLTVAFILNDGSFFRGDDLDGWKALQQPSLEVCLSLKERIMQLPLPSGISSMMLQCVEREIIGKDT